ncbi:hypothetical protein MKZ38_004451 [Zalerion maritima]|uniref:Uncharacterized protein n=1 Tax=Zalerion maritima TaxID=339359 RepID=A0AAD5WUG8_9PEZI|nr:hypothetical protein MKZ38_004451 [Zalerion maritima]
MAKPEDVSPDSTARDTPLVVDKNNPRNKTPSNEYSNVLNNFKISAYTGLGTVSRRSLISQWGGEEATLNQKTTISAISGGIAAAASGALRGIKHIRGGVFPFVLIGGVGQYLYGSFEAVTIKPKEGWLASKYSPLKRIPDEEYAKMLEEKLLGVEADIALLDEKIEAARARIRERERPSLDLNE